MMTRAALADEVLGDELVTGERGEPRERRPHNAWVADARRWYWQAGPEHPGYRAEAAWHLICARPAGSRLVDAAAALAGWEPAEVWAMLKDRVVSSQ